MITSQDDTAPKLGAVVLRQQPGLITSQDDTAPKLSSGFNEGTEIGAHRSFDLDIIIPKGSKGAYVGEISKHKYEHEFLIQAGSEFRLIGIDYKMGAGLSHGEVGMKLLLELVDQNPIMP